jgi:hypothetical protein
MRVRSAFTAFAASYFVLVFLRDGTMVRLIKDASKGAQDLAKGLRGPAKLA